MDRYKVFISSTIEDLTEARDAAEHSLASAEVFEPRRVEKLPAHDDPSRIVCLEEVRSSDAVVLIIGQRDGFVPTENNPGQLSVTHLEYREAKRRDRPVFVFVQQDAVREEPLARFLAEIEDFGSGVFRKEWTAQEDLSREVLRSLLWWVARRARSSEIKRFPIHVVERELGIQGLQQTYIRVENLIPTVRAVDEWIENILRNIRDAASRELIPKPALSQSNGSTTESSPISLSLSEIKNSQSLSVKLTVLDAGQAKHDEAETDRAPKTRHLSLEIEPDAAGARVLERVVRAALYLLGEDPNECVELLLKSSQDETASEKSRDALLGTAAAINLSYNLEHTFTIGECVLNLKEPTFNTLNAASWNTLLASARFQTRVMRNAGLISDQLTVKLLLRQIKLGVAGAEAVYTIGRKALDKKPNLALQIYTELVKAHPFYEERWYWHRDLGLLYYHKGDYIKAAHFYDNARALKPDDSELCRHAGDAYYYQGMWMEAINRYEKAMRIEPIEVYYVDAKVDFARKKLLLNVHAEQLWNFRRKVAHFLSGRGVLLSKWNFRAVPKLIFRLARWVCPIDLVASKELAFYANQEGDYDRAVTLLRTCLTAIPESPSTRLNLAANLIWLNKSHWNEESRRQAKAAIFHGGLEMKERIRLCLSRTDNRDELIRVFEQELFTEVEGERGAWRMRRQEVLKPQEYGGILHIEIRP